MNHPRGRGDYDGLRPKKLRLLGRWRKIMEARRSQNRSEELLASHGFCGLYEIHVTLGREMGRGIRLRV